MKADPIIYCDYAATAPLRPEVRAAMAAAEERLYGNPSSIHRPGQAAKVALERARKVLARSLGAQPGEVIFTSGGTEANNMALLGLLKGGDHVVTSMIEHPSVQRPLERLEERGVAVTRVAPAATGEVPVERVADALRPDTRLITIMAVNNETGVINDIAALGALAAERGVLFHTDAVQAFGKLPIQAEQSGIHFLSASAHKIGGPKGIGLLYARRRIEPLQLGGSQEHHLRGGTENLAGAVGFARAVELALESQEELHRRLEDLRGIFLQELRRAGVSFHVNGANGYPGIVNLCFPGVSGISRGARRRRYAEARYAQGHALVLNLDMNNVAASYGSSCASGSAKASHVLLAMGLSEEEAGQSVRFSFGCGTTEDEVLTVAGVVARVVARMKQGTRVAASEAG